MEQNKHSISVDLFKVYVVNNFLLQTLKCSEMWDKLATVVTLTSGGTENNTDFLFSQFLPKHVPGSPHHKSEILERFIQY